VLYAEHSMHTPPPALHHYQQQQHQHQQHHASSGVSIPAAYSDTGSNVGGDHGSASSKAYLGEYASTVAYDHRSSHAHAGTSTSVIASHGLSPHSFTQHGASSSLVPIQARASTAPQGVAGAAGYGMGRRQTGDQYQIPDDRVAVTQPLRQLVHLATNTVSGAMSNHQLPHGQHLPYSTRAGIQQDFSSDWRQDHTHGHTHGHTSHNSQSLSWLPAPPSPGPWLD
jgi:hypothetical protein